MSAMDLTTFEYEGVVYYTALRSEEQSSTEAQYTVHRSENFYHWDGVVLFDSHRHIRLMGYVHWTVLPQHLKPLVLPEGACFDMRESRLFLRHEASRVYPSKPYTQEVEWIVPMTLRADIDGDYLVDATDFGILLSEWGTDSERSDLTGDGIVDGEDIGVLLLAWS